MHKAAIDCADPRMVASSRRTLEVAITVDAQAAPYFKRRRLIANQVIVKELADGGLIVSARVGHAN